METCRGFEEDTSDPSSSLFSPNFNSFNLVPGETDWAETTSLIFYIKRSFENCKNNPTVSGSANMVNNYNEKREKIWIFDCGATDTMTYELSDLI